MYTFSFRGNSIEELKRACQNSPSITDRLEEMESNPFYKAKKTGIPAIGEYYVNAGRYCIIFDIDNDNEKIHVRLLILSNTLHKLIKWKIPVPTAILDELNK